MKKAWARLGKMDQVVFLFQILSAPPSTTSTFVHTVYILKSKTESKILKNNPPPFPLSQSSRPQIRSKFSSSTTAFHYLWQTNLGGLHFSVVQSGYHVIRRSSLLPPNTLDSTTSTSVHTVQIVWTKPRALPSYTPNESWRLHYNPRGKPYPGMANPFNSTTSTTEEFRPFGAKPRAKLCPPTLKLK